MKLSPGIFAAALASGALAAPGSTLAERMEQRGMSHLTKPKQQAGDSTDASTQFRQAANVQYSQNWAGLVREKPPPEGPYTAVTATFTIPTSTPVPVEGESSGPDAGSIWVGIDGDTYNKAILQTGVDFYSDIDHPNHAWFEWYPAYATNFENIDINEGQTIVASVRSNSPSEGVAIIENRSTGQSVTKTVTAPSSDATLAGENADWIVEAFQSGGNQVVMADFGELKFTGVEADAGGAKYGTKDAEIIAMKQNDKVLTETEITSDSEFKVKYLNN
ncbi:peptidase A4 family-domain-containing protein [Aspergillus avenaceus]|uniref:Peptidase A4 family-domain-containing protein n=1 Tax=Aspergillus avenaceus TaxID=36643 RepID=A0A5N6U3Y8_ASPAV|nr:peptidase A4 family-domain-containing protein [Aspergillus avenaceus]